MEYQNVMDCGYNDSMIAYMYGETGSLGDDAFENHLLDCSKCAEQFAELAESRFGVFEWHKESFVPLRTPDFVIPRSPAGWRSTLAGFSSWATIPRLSVGFAAVLLLLSVAFVAMNEVATSDGIARARTKVVKTSDVGPMIASSLNLEMTAEKVSGDDTKAAPTDAPRRIRTGHSHASPSLSQVRVARSEMALRDTDNGKSPADGHSVDRSTKAPVLSSFVENDDKSLRLADLVDDIGG